MTTHSPLAHARCATESWRAGTALILGIALVLSACGREPSGTRRPGVSLLEVNGLPTTPDLVLEAGDDLSFQLLGLQVALACGAEGIHDGTEGWVTAGEQTLAVAQASGGILRFDVTLGTGVTELRVGCETCEEQAFALTVAEDALRPTLGLGNGETLLLACSADREPGTDGLQLDLEVEAREIPQGTAVEVELSSGPERYPGVVIDGVAVVRVTTAPETGELSVTARATVEAEVVEVTAQARAHCPRCDFRTLGGEPMWALRIGTARYAVGPTMDASASEGLQIDVEVDVDGAPGTDVTLYSDGAMVARIVQDNEGRARYPEVPVAEGTVLEVTCALPAVDEDPSRARLEVVTDAEPPDAVDDLSCQTWQHWALCTWTAPADQGPYAGAARWELRYVDGAPLDEATFASATLVTTAPTATTNGMPITALFEMTSAPAPEAVSFALRSWDHAGNRSALSNVADGLDE